MRTPANPTLKSLEKYFMAGDFCAHAKILCRLIRLDKPNLAAAIEQHALCDEWLDFCFQSLDSHFKLAHGFVYCARPMDKRHILKVGKTAQSPHERIKQLNNESVVTHFALEGAFWVPDRHWAEARVHQLLKEEGVQIKKEFFYTDFSHVSELLKNQLEQDAQRFRRFGYVANSTLHD